MPAVFTLLGKETRIIMKRFRPARAILPEFGMPWIDEPIRLGWRQGGGNDENCGTTPPDEIVADLGEFGRRRCSAPIPRQSSDRHRDSRDTVRNFGTGQHEIAGWVIRVDVHKVFNDRQRKVFGRVGKTHARARPAPAKAISAFTTERPFGIESPEDSIDWRQLRPPYAIRPSTFSTARAPGSVSIKSSGAGPPKARFGRLSHRLAFSSSPIYRFARAMTRASR